MKHTFDVDFNIKDIHLLILTALQGAKIMCLDPKYLILSFPAFHTLQWYGNPDEFGDIKLVITPEKDNFEVEFGYDDPVFVKHRTFASLLQVGFK